MRRLLTAALAAISLAAVGCSSDDEEPRTKHTPALHIEAVEASRWGSRRITMPQTGLRYDIVGAPVVPEGNFIATGVYEVGPPDMRRNALLVQVDNKGAGEIYAMSGKANGKRLFLLVDDMPVGVRLIDGPMRGGDIFFDVEVPGASKAERDQALFKLSDDLNEAILKVREEKEAK